MMGYGADFEQAGSRTTGTPKTANNYNIAIGYQSILGQSKNHGILLGANTYISQNYALAIGDSARNSGLNSIAFGRGTNVTGANSIAIGYGATVSADNEVYIGNNATASIGGSVNWTALSDQRYKQEVREDVPGLDFINRLRPVTYAFDPQKLAESDSCPTDMAEALQQKSEQRFTGFLAQEVEAAATASGYGFSGVDRPSGDSDVYGLRYAEFTVPLVKSVQELSEKVEKLEAQLADKTSEYNALSTEMAEMKRMILELKATQPVQAMGE